MKIILSIKPQFVREIFEGSKRFEYRRIMCKRPVDTVIIYCSAPISMVVGEFSVKRVIAETPDSLWRLTRDMAGINKEYFDNYFFKREKGFAFQISIQDFRTGSILLYSKRKSFGNIINR